MNTVKLLSVCSSPIHQGHTVQPELTLRLLPAEGGDRDNDVITPSLLEAGTLSLLWISSVPQTTHKETETAESMFPCVSEPQSSEEKLGQWRRNEEGGEP